MDIYYNGHKLPQVDSFVIAGGPLGGRTERETVALRYLWRRINAGRDYVSLVKMAAALNLTYDLCETFIAKFHAERVIPRLVIVEEVEG